MNLDNSSRVSGLEAMQGPRIQVVKTRGSEAEARKVAEKELREKATGRGAFAVIGVKRATMKASGGVKYIISGQPAKKIAPKAAEKPYMRDYRDGL